MQQNKSRQCAFSEAAMLVLIVALGGSGGCSSPAVAIVESPPTAGTRLDTSKLKLVDLDSQPVDLKKFSTSRVHVAVFTRTDCPVSNQFAPEVRGLYDKLHSQGADIVLIYVDPNEKSDVIRKHLRDYQYPCPGLRDPDHTLVAQTGATVTPEAVIFDNDWRIVYRGRINNEYVEVGKSRTTSIQHDLQKAIEATLAGQPVAEPLTRAVGCYIGDLK